jgi:hypothetical protein
VIVNNEYQGIYTLVEKIKRDKHRVDIAKLDPDDNAGDSLTGGYIFKIDNNKGDAFWKSSYAPEGYAIGDVSFIYEYPKTADITAQQKKYLKDYIDAFEKVLFSTNYTNAKNGYYNYIDIMSFVDYFLVGEITRNIDAYKKSCYYYKDKVTDGGLIHAGPVWDFDWAWKNFSECFENNLDGSGWAYQIFDCKPSPVPPAWMTRMVGDSTFANKCHTRYNQLRLTILYEEHINSYMDSIETLLNVPQERHYSTWDILGKRPCGWGCDVLGTPEIDDIPATYHGEVTKLKKWISMRLDFLDQNMIGKATPIDIYNLQQALLPYRMYPNPCKEILHIESSKCLAEISIYSTDGRLLISKSNINNNIYAFNVNSLRKNLYVVRIKYKSGEVSNAKLIIE